METQVSTRSGDLFKVYSQPLPAEDSLWRAVNGSAERRSNLWHHWMDSVKRELQSQELIGKALHQWLFGMWSLTDTESRFSHPSLILPNGVAGAYC